MEGSRREPKAEANKTANDRRGALRARPTYGAEAAGVTVLTAQKSAWSIL
jgi:hypothetical protein